VIAVEHKLLMELLVQPVAEKLEPTQEQLRAGGQRSPVCAPVGTQPCSPPCAGRLQRACLPCPAPFLVWRAKGPIYAVIPATPPGSWH
jgi:hypothetical protein